MSLASFIYDRKAELLASWATRAAVGAASESVDRAALEDHIGVFLAALAFALEEGDLPPNRVGSEHGEQRFELGFNVTAVVREYGLLLDTLLEALEASSLRVTIPQMRELIRLVTAASADAVTAYVALRDEDTRRLSSQHLGFLAHELRNPLHTAHLASSLIHESVAQRPVKTLRRALGKLEDLLDNTLVASKLGAAAPLVRSEFELRDVLRDAASESELDALAKEITLAFEGEALQVSLDRRLLRSAVTNLIRNAVKFSGHGGKVTVRSRVGEEGRVVVEVEDSCGGLPEGAAATMFNAFKQASTDRTGHGLGLAIARQAIEAHEGTIQAHDLPGQGCVFVIEMPQRASPTLTSAVAAVPSKTP